MIRILLVDDEPLICKGYKQNLERLEGYEVRTVSNPLDATGVAKVFAPDVIILDYIMPDLNGCELAEQLKRDQKTQDIPLMFLTASGDTQDKVIQEDLSEYKVVAKPISAEELVEEIKGLVGQE